MQAWSSKTTSPHFNRDTSAESEASASAAAVAKATTRRPPYLGIGAARDDSSTSSSDSSTPSPTLAPSTIPLSEIIKLYRDRLHIIKTKDPRTPDKARLFLVLQQETHGDFDPEEKREKAEVTQNFYFAIMDFLTKSKIPFSPDEIKKHSSHITFGREELLDAWIKYSSILIEKPPREIKKIAIVGAGDLAKAITKELIEFHKQNGLHCEIVIINRNIDSINSILSEVITTPSASLEASDDLGDIRRAALIINTAGVRLGLSGALRRESAPALGYNLAPLHEFGVALKRSLRDNSRDGFPDPWIINLVNPVEHFSEVIRLVSGIDPTKIIGSGMQLDSIRFSESLSRELGQFLVDGEVESVVVGTHTSGSMIPLKSMARIGGMPLADIVTRGTISRGSLDEIFDRSTAEIQDAGVSLARSSADGRGPSYLPAQAACALISGLLYGKTPKLMSASVYTTEYGEGKYVGLPIFVSEGDIKAARVLSSDDPTSPDLPSDGRNILASPEEMHRLREAAQKITAPQISDRNVRISQDLNRQLQESRENAKAKLIKTNELRSRIPEMTHEDLANPDFRELLKEIFTMTKRGAFYHLSTTTGANSQRLLENMKSGLEGLELINPEEDVIFVPRTEQYLLSLL
jgi:malate/lactate dehydrogenase